MWENWNGFNHNALNAKMEGINYSLHRIITNWLKSSGSTWFTQIHDGSFQNRCYGAIFQRTLWPWCNNRKTEFITNENILCKLVLPVFDLVLFCIFLFWSFVFLILIFLILIFILFFYISLFILIFYSYFLFSFFILIFGFLSFFF